MALVLEIGSGVGEGDGDGDGDAVHKLDVPLSCTSD